MSELRHLQASPRVPKHVRLAPLKQTSRVYEYMPWSPADDVADVGVKDQISLRPDELRRMLPPPCGGLGT